MTNQEFVNFAKFKAQQWLSHNADNMDGISTDDIFVVWYAKTLQNHKALLGTRFANYYFECTYDRNKEVMYMDVLGATWQDMKMFKVHRQSPIRRMINMSRKHPWDFKNRREQHEFMADLEKCLKHSYRHMSHVTVHSKRRWRKAEYIRGRDWAIKARLNGWIK